MRSRLGRQPPGGDRIGWGAIWGALRSRDPERILREELSRRLEADAITLHASGREALRVGLAHLAKASGRSEVIVPAYTCFSVPASAVAAGLEVRLVDVTPRGQIDASSLARLPLERAAALVVCNLLGVPEPIAPLRELLLGSGVAIVDDAAQSFGAGSDEGAVGGRGDLGVLSFGRGKPLSALGGGALAWRKASDLAAPRVDRPRPLTAACRAAGYDLARVPWVFQALSAIPALGIGDTLYAPDFPRGPIDGASLCLAVGALTALDELTRQRRGRAERLARRLQKRTSFVPLVAESAAFPRLGLVAPSQAVRDVALEALAPLGATRLYPSPIDRIAGLRAHRVGTIPCPGAETFASRLMTLPTHAGLGSHLDAMAATLEGIA